MTFTVCIVDTATQALAEQFLPRTSWIAGGGRTYFLYSSPGRMPAIDYRDLDGSPLIECRTFNSHREAGDWVRSDLAWRTAAEKGRVE